MVVMPHGRDQIDNAARVAARAGIAVKRTAAPAVIADAVRRALADPSYRDAAGRLGEAIRRDAEGDALVRELTELPANLGTARG